MTNNDPVIKEVCKLQRAALDERISGLEKRAFEAVKQAMTVSEMSHSGNKESLQSLLNMMQEGAYEEISKFENVEKRISLIDKTIKDIEENLSFFNQRKDDIKKIQNLVTSLKLLRQAFESTKDILTIKIDGDVQTINDTIETHKKLIKKQLKHIRYALLIIGLILTIHLVAPEKTLGDLVVLIFKAIT